jgi:hypothetical protein
MKNSVSLVLISLVFGIGLRAGAQKLPNVQTESVKAPADIKIDGKVDEWNNQFKAYNHSTEVYYTLSNDDQHLYLALQATIPDVVNKIIAGGITLTIQKSDKKNDKRGVSITYPIYEKNNRPTLGITHRVSMENGVTHTETSSPPMNDSTINARNKQLRDKSKYIGVTGLPGLDTLISIYNENGIRTGQLMDSKGAYTYELSVDLKLLGLSANEVSKFAYHLVLNGVNGGDAVVKIKSADGSAPTPEMQNMANEMMAKMNAANGGMMTPTDFWGEYTLAK